MPKYLGILLPRWHSAMISGMLALLATAQAKFYYLGMLKAIMKATVDMANGARSGTPPTLRVHKQ